MREVGRSGCRNLGDVPNVRDNLSKNASWEGRSEATDRLIGTHVGAREVGRSGCRILGSALNGMGRSHE